MRLLSESSVNCTVVFLNWADVVIVLLFFSSMNRVMWSLSWGSFCDYKGVAKREEGEVWISSRNCVWVPSCRGQYNCSSFFVYLRSFHR